MSGRHLLLLTSFPLIVYVFSILRRSRYDNDNMTVSEYLAMYPLFVTKNARAFFSHDLVALILSYLPCVADLQRIQAWFDFGKRSISCKSISAKPRVCIDRWSQYITLSQNSFRMHMPFDDFVRLLLGESDKLQRYWTILWDDSIRISFSTLIAICQDEFVHSSPSWPIRGLLDCQTSASFQFRNRMQFQI
jgi:hypothetical protein